MLVDVDLINAALRHVAQSPIASMEDKSPQGVAARLAWDLAFNDFLTVHDWTFATRYEVLPMVTANDETAKVWEWSNLFILPLDFERLVAVQEAPDADSFAISLHGTVRVLGMNGTTATIKYISNDFPLSVLPSPARLFLMAQLAFHLDMMLAAGVNSNALSEFVGRNREKAIAYDGTSHSIHILEPRELLDSREG